MTRPDPSTDRPSPNGGRLREAVAAGVFGGVLGAAAGAPFDLTAPVGAVAAANGAISGWRQIYDWRRPAGVAGFVLDSTWSFVMTGAGLVANAIGTLSPSGGYVAELSRRQGRHVFRGGFRTRGRYVVTLGNVISGAGDTTGARRRRLITDHENVHVWQARWLGPVFPAIYVSWSVGGAILGPVVWLARGRRERLAQVVETCAYYLNPLEWWAYSRDDNWPPGGKVADLGWRLPIARPLGGSGVPPVGGRPESRRVRSRHPPGQVSPTR